MPYHRRVELRVDYRGDGEIAAQLGPLMLRVLGGIETTHESVDRLLAMLDRILARWPLVGVLVLVEHGTPKPSPEIRRRVDDELRRYGDRIVVGYAFLGLGFWNADAREFAAERAASLGVTVFATATVRELATRVSLELVGVDPEAVERTCEQLRSELRLVDPLKR